MVDKDRNPNEAGEQPDPLQMSTESGRLRETLVSARRAFGRSFDQVTGAEFRRQFEEFSGVVTTTVLGIHRDQAELRDRLAAIEQSQLPNSNANKLVVATFVLSLVAMILGVAALLRTI